MAVQTLVKVHLGLWGAPEMALMAQLLKGKTRRVQATHSGLARTQSLVKRGLGAQGLSGTRVPAPRHILLERFPALEQP